jgi:hypothetical protein
VVDPTGEWLAGWKANFSFFEIPVLRSHMLAHPDPRTELALMEAETACRAEQSQGQGQQQGQRQQGQEWDDEPQQQQQQQQRRVRGTKRRGKGDLGYVFWRAVVALA